MYNLIDKGIIVPETANLKQREAADFRGISR